MMLVKWFLKLADRDPLLVIPVLALIIAALLLAAPVWVTAF